MNILYIARNIPVPGIKQNDIILRICKAINSDSGFNISVWYPKEVIPRLFALSKRLKLVSQMPKKFKSFGISIFALEYFRLPTLKFSYLWLDSFFFFNKKLLMESSDFDLIHAHYILPDGYFGLVLKKKLEIPLVITIRNGDLDKINKLNQKSKLYKLYHYVLDQADKIIVHNHITEKYAQKRKLLYKKLPHGIEKKYISEFKKEETNKILCVSQFIKRKNINWLIDAFNRFGKTEWRLTIIGSGELESRLKIQSGKNPNIHFRGEVPREEVIDEMKNSDIFVLPSDNETFGIVYMEAAVSGCAVIGKRFTGLYGWLDEDLEAMFVDSKDELFETLEKLMSKPDIRKSIGQYGRNKVITNLLFEDQIIRYMNFYEHLIIDNRSK